jgi:hypothetical protein
LWAEKVIRGWVWFLQGFFVKTGLSSWFFDGESVVFCMVDVEFRQPLLEVQKK